MTPTQIGISREYLVRFCSIKNGAILRSTEQFHQVLEPIDPDIDKGKGTKDQSPEEFDPLPLDFHIRKSRTESS
jgi:hypothetical protein